MTDLSAPGHAAVRVVRADDPRAEAARLAEETGGDIAADGDSAERLVRERVEAGRRAHGGDAGDADLLARGDEVRAAATAEPPVSDTDVEELRQLAEDLDRATRIKDRTEAKVADQLRARVAASTGVALHPSAVLAAAKGVVDAEDALEAAEREVLEHGAPPQSDEPVATSDDRVLPRPHDDFDEDNLERRRAIGRMAVVVAIVAVAVVGTAVAGGPVAIVAAVGVVLLALSGVLVARSRQRSGGAEAAADLLAAIGRAVAATDSGRLLAAMHPEDDEPEEDTREEWVELRARLDGARDEAEELLRVARNRWHQLAGPDADAHEPEIVIRTHDPQLVYDARVSLSSPTARTAAAFHRRVQARWRIVWAGLGRDEPPAPEELEAILDEILAEHRAALAELQRLEEAEARQAAGAAVRRPLIVVEPGAWVEAGRLAQLLSSVPPAGDVVLVERGVPDG